jgi:hypothetical protein
MDLIHDIKDTHTYDYFVIVDCTPQQLQTLRKRFLFDLDPLTGDYLLNVAFWSEEDRQELQQYLKHYHIKYDVMRSLRAVDD